MLLACMHARSSYTGGHGLTLRKQIHVYTDHAHVAVKYTLITVYSNYT